MALADYIKTKLRRFHLSMDDAELNVLLAGLGESPASELTETSMVVAKRVIVSAIPELLLVPDVSQGDYSHKLNKDAVVKYYGMLCDELGVENKLTPQPKVRDKSNYW